MQIFASLLRASRALLGKDQEAVALWVNLDRREVGAWEAAKYKLMSKAGIDLRKAFEREGVDFVEATGGMGQGVRLRKPAVNDPHRSAQYRAARALTGLSQLGMADASGVNRNFIARLEKGDIAGVNLKTLKQLDRAYGQLNVEFIPETLTTGVGVRWTKEETE